MTEVHVRTATLEYSEGQLFGLLVPYNVRARVVDVLPDGKLDVYDEGFRGGAFERQAQSTEPGVIKRVAFWHTHDHQEGAGYFGPARSLEERADGLVGEFKILPTKRADLQMLIDEGHADLSVEFREARGTTEIDDAGVRWRTKAHLGGVALDPAGAYPGAEVLSYRSVPELVAEWEQQRNVEADTSVADRQRAEEEAAEAAERARVEAERAAALEAAGEKARRMAELDEWLAAAREKQAALSSTLR